LEVRLYYIEQFKLASAKHEKPTGINNCLMKAFLYRQSGSKTFRWKAGEQKLAIKVYHFMQNS